MKKFIPFEKLSKKKKREQMAKKRGGWGGLKPVTRRPENPRAYNRKKARKWSEDSMTVPFALRWQAARRGGLFTRTRPVGGVHQLQQIGRGGLERNGGFGRFGSLYWVGI
jgi:hypothetical protein